jgi:threonine dehydrogenase-like Zn-dependent dehydrogenase
MTTVHAYAATTANGPLEPFEYELGPIGHEVSGRVSAVGEMVTHVLDRH